MAQQVQAKQRELQSKLEAMLSSVEDERLRPMRKQGFLAMAKCCDLSDPTAYQQCLQKAQLPEQRASQVVQTELNDFQGRLQRAIATCQDDVKDGPRAASDTTSYAIEQRYPRGPIIVRVTLHAIGQRYPRGRVDGVRTVASQRRRLLGPEPRAERLQHVRRKGLRRARVYARRRQEAHREGTTLVNIQLVCHSVCWIGRLHHHSSAEGEEQHRERRAPTGQSGSGGSDAGSSRNMNAGPRRRAERTI